MIADAMDIIEVEGQDHNNTREAIGIYLTLSVDMLDLSKEELLIRNYYGGIYEERAEDERYHYEQIKYSLLHKVKEVKYFFNQDLESRKLITFSNDCISSVQYLKRGNEANLLVHMRSSDVLGLLPIDTLNLCKILLEINETYAKDQVTESTLLLVLGSAHYYKEGGRH